VNDRAFVVIIPPARGTLELVATQTQVSVEEYLRTSFTGADCDFVDGEIVERNVGGNRHSTTQGRLIEFFYDLRKSHPFYARPELRFKLHEGRFRVADVAVFEGEPPVAEVPSTPPLIVIEIVSRDDRYTEIVEKLDEYRAWGVQHVWLVDPYLRKIYTCGNSGLREVSEFLLPPSGFRLTLDDIV
jgi:Uma2 family endonuclease